MVLGIGAATAYVGNGLLPWYILLLVVLSVVCTAMAGFVINDYFDIKIDRINHPDRLIVTRRMSRDGAMHYFYGLVAVAMVFGLVAAWLTESKYLAGVAVLMPGLLWFHSSSYKRQFMVGDVVISVAAAMAPLSVALAANTQEAYLILGERAIQFMLGAWIFTLLQALDEEAGDRELEVHSMPVVCGRLATKIAIAVLCVLFLAVTVHVVVRF